MIVDIHNVGHGACLVATSSDGKKVMVDCGHSTDPEWRPSSAYMMDTFQALIVSNFDEDHVSDFPGMMRRYDQPAAPRGLLGAMAPDLVSISFNTSVTAADLAALKPQGLGTGMVRFKDYLEAAERGYASDIQPDFGTMYVASFFNTYPFLNDRANTNDISLVTVVLEGDLKLVSCGDITANGFRHLLLANPGVQDLIANTSVLIAPHHGRADGYDAEVMDLISPTLVVFSDKRIEHETQKTADLYARHATGQRVFSGSGFGEERQVLTTRKDGHIRVETGTLLAGWMVTTGV